MWHHWCWRKLVYTSFFRHRFKKDKTKHKLDVNMSTLQPSAFHCTDTQFNSVPSTSTPPLQKKTHISHENIDSISGRPGLGSTCKLPGSCTQQECVDPRELTQSSSPELHRGQGTVDRGQGTGDRGGCPSQKHARHGRTVKRPDHQRFVKSEWFSNKPPAQLRRDDQSAPKKKKKSPGQEQPWPLILPIRQPEGAQDILVVPPPARHTTPPHFEILLWRTRVPRK